MVDFPMDIAKAVVSGVVIKILATVALSTVSLPIIFTTGSIILIGLCLNIGLNILDDKLGISKSLKIKLQEYMQPQKHIINDHGFNAPYFYSF
ncbi:TPA: hypothetical protein O7U53_004658 [Salmonella enterica]|nr:hypothetical protein [Salmonella enterica]